MAKRSTFVGLDVHKESIAVAIAESGRFGKVRALWDGGRAELEALDKVLRGVAGAGPDAALRCTRRVRVGSRSSAT